MAFADKKVSILGTGHYVPTRIMPNAELESMVDTTDQWIQERTGIRERRIASPEEHASDMGAQAAQRALKSAGIKPNEIDAIIVATLTPDYPWPATACLVQRKIGAPQAFAFDISAACSGLVYAMSVAHGMIVGGTASRVLIIGSEKLSTILDWTDRNSCVLFGDGAGAMVLGPSNGKAVICGLYLGTDGEQVEALFQPGGGSVIPLTVENVSERQQFLKMNGKDVFKFAVRVMGEAAVKVAEVAGWNSSDIDLLVPHQANIRIIDAAAKRLGITMDKVFVNLEKYGNTSAASVGIALDEAIEQKRVKTGDKVVLVAFGAGLTWASAAIEW